MRNDTKGNVNWEGTQPLIQFSKAKNKLLNFEIALVEGEGKIPPVPRARYFPEKNEETQLDLIAIDGIRQGDKIVLDAVVNGKPVTASINIVKGFTWNDLQNLGGKDKLKFAPELDDLPPSVKESILNTILFSLEPPNLSSRLPNDQELDQLLNAPSKEERLTIMAQLGLKLTDQEFERLRIRKKLDELMNTKQEYKNSKIAPFLATFRIPSTMAVSAFPQEDLFHFHLAVPAFDSQVKTDILTYKSAWGRKFEEILSREPNIDPNTRFPYGSMGYRNVYLQHYKAILQKFIDNISKQEVLGIKDYLKKVGSQDFVELHQPMCIYHTYEFRVFGGVEISELFSKQPPYWPDYYANPKEINSDKKFYAGDPIRNIQTQFNDKLPRMFITLTAYSEHDSLWNVKDPKIKEYIPYELMQIGFFIDSEGQIVIFPTIGHPEPHVAVFQVADALGELKKLREEMNKGK